MSLEIGNGTATKGTMSAIDWSTGIYFVKTTVDGVEMGTSQLLSVPYAQYAKISGNNFSASDAAKLAGITAGAEVNVNPDWNAASGDAQILNKPVIPTADGSETKVHGTPGVQNGNFTVTVTGTGTTTDPYVISSSAVSSGHFIGESFGGGIVFYVYDNGKHGLIAATEDVQYYNGEGYEPTFPWEFGYSINTVSTGDGLCAGMMNTAIIVAALIGNDASGPFAAKLCSDHSSTVDDITWGGWYLPSEYELNLLYLQRDILTGFAEDYYWSSTEDKSQGGYVWCQDFTQGSGNQSSYAESVYLHARPIRSF